MLQCHNPSPLCTTHGTQYTASSCRISACSPAQGLKLYWRALEGLVAAEGARPDASPGAGASLLAAPAFHRCVAACAFELLAAAYRVVSAQSAFHDAVSAAVRCSGEWLPQPVPISSGRTVPISSSRTLDEWPAGQPRALSMRCGTLLVQRTLALPAVQLERPRLPLPCPLY